MISIFLNLLRPNFWPEVWFILEKVFHVHLRMCMLLLLGRVFPIHLLHLVDSVASSISLLLSGCFIHYCEWNIDVPNHYCRALYFFLQFCQFLLHIFWWSVIRCAHVYNCYIFLLQCTFCWYTMPFSFYSSGNVLISSSFWRTVFSDIGILTDCVFFSFRVLNVLAHCFLTSKVFNDKSANNLIKDPLCDYLLLLLLSRKGGGACNNRGDTKTMATCPMVCTSVIRSSNQIKEQIHNIWREQSFFSAWLLQAMCKTLQEHMQSCLPWMW